MGRSRRSRAASAWTDWPLDGAGNLYSTGSAGLARTTPAGERTDLSQVDPCCPDPDGSGPARILRYFNGVALDGAGNLYVTERNNDRVYRIDPAGGTLTPIAGGGSVDADHVPATQVHLGQPKGIAVDADRNVYFTEEYGGRVRKVDAAGIITTVAGGGASGLGDGGPATSASLSSPTGVALGAAGDIFIADTGNLRVRRVSAAGIISTVAGSGAGTHSGDGRLAVDAQMGLPSGVAADSKDNVYVVDYDTDRVRKVDAAGVITTVAGGAVHGFAGDGGPATAAQLLGPMAIAFDRQDRLFIADGWNNRVRRIDQSGVISTVAGGGQQPPADGVLATAAAFTRMLAVTIDASDALYLADDSWSVWKVGTDGRLRRVAGGGKSFKDGVPATSAALSFEMGTTLGADGAGNVYVADIGTLFGGRVRRIDPAGIITTVLGPTTRERRTGADRVSMNFTPAFAVDANGRLFFGEPYRGQVWEVDRMGAVHLVAGTGDNTSPLGDGGPAVKGRLALRGPRALAFDSKGSLYLADAADLRVRKVSFAAPPGRAVACGWDGYGQLGTPSKVDTATPRAVAGIAGVHSMSGGWWHSLFAMGDGSVRASGRNVLGELGDGTNTDQTTPVAVQGLTGVTAVAAGALHSLALTSDGTVWAWGWNGLGQLGDGTNLDRSRPVQVVGLPKIVAISAGAHHNVALGEDGSVWSWGWNAFGQLGDGTTTDRRVPVRVPNFTNAQAVSAGTLHTLAVQDSYAWGWGWNAAGQVGDGTTTDRWSPVRTAFVAGGTVAAGTYHSLALYSGVVLAWGWNSNGQLGIPSAGVVTTPTVVPGLKDVLTVSTGILHSVAVAGDGTVWSWGWNAYGALCDGTTTDRLAPVAVDSLRGADLVTAGGVHTLALPG